MYKKVFTVGGVWFGTFYFYLIRTTQNVYIKSCSHEVAKHKSGVICRFHPMVPPRPLAYDWAGDTGVQMADQEYAHVAGAISTSWTKYRVR
jgi:hypothetical protein